MPVKPEATSLSASTVDILNAIRNSATANYRDYVPVAVNNDSSVREIGAVIMQFPALQNEFLGALVNRIGRVIMTSKMYTNPWAPFKRGLLEFGETIEEVFVNIAKPFEFDPEKAQDTVFKRQIPDVRAAFHPLNYQKMYKTTVSQDQLRQAFLSIQGITDLISKIVDSMYSAANYDEFLVMKYMIARHILKGQMYPVTIPAVSADDMEAIVKKIKGISNNFEFMTDDYNLAGVHTFSMKDTQYLIMTGDFDAAVNVDVLAAAFNMDKAEFSGHTIMVDSFAKLDNNRLAALFADDANYVEITQAELTALATIPAVLVDIDWFMIYDNLLTFSDLYNPEGLYWNYWLHTWKTMSVSPFANNALFIPGTPTVTKVEVTPSAVTAAAGQQVQLTVKVTTTNFAPQTVKWTSDTEGVDVDIYGLVTIGADVAAGTVNVTATSTYDGTKSGNSVITVA